MRGQGLGRLALPLLLCMASGETVRYFPSLISLQATDFFQLFIQLLPKGGVEERDPGHYSCAVGTSQLPADRSTVLFEVKRQNVSTSLFAGASVDISMRVQD